MSEKEIKSRYFDWIAQKVEDKRHITTEKFNHKGYYALLRRLFMTPFVYTMPMDENRFEDGIDLRYRFSYENDIPDYIISSELDYMDCSMLEMMAALAIRCEEHIMADPDVGDRTSVWFWTMIDSLGLSRFTNDRMDNDEVLLILDKFYNRCYGKNGKGSIFTITDNSKDMRRMELWDQTMSYLVEYIERKEKL